MLLVLDPAAAAGAVFYAVSSRNAGWPVHRQISPRLSRAVGKKVEQAEGGGWDSAHQCARDILND